VLAAAGGAVGADFPVAISISSWWLVDHLVSVRNVPDDKTKASDRIAAATERPSRPRIGISPHNESHARTRQGARPRSAQRTKRCVIVRTDQNGRRDPRPAHRII
jgi:hypothetical protein